MKTKTIDGVLHELVTIEPFGSCWVPRIKTDQDEFEDAWLAGYSVAFLNKTYTFTRQDGVKFMLAEFRVEGWSQTKRTLIFDRGSIWEGEQYYVFEVHENLKTFMLRIKELYITITKKEVKK